MKIHCLTISQPWASRIADGTKVIENRCWETRYRGPLAIHAGSGTQYLTKKELADWPTGQVIAVANLVACVNRQEAMARNRDCLIGGTNMTIGRMLQDVHCEGPWCWILQDVRKLKIPKKIPGAQGIWSFFDREWEGRF